MFCAPTSLLLLFPPIGATRPSTQPTASEGSLHVSWLVVVKPDEEAKKLGLQEFTTTIMIDRGALWDSTFHTRGGCIANGYPPAKATWYDTGSTESFTAKYEATEEAGASSLSWKGILSEHRITGEVTLAIAGPRRSVEEIDKLLEPARQSLLREPRAFDAGGTLINGAVIESLERDVERRGWLSPRQAEHSTSTSKPCRQTSAPQVGGCRRQSRRGHRDSARPPPPWIWFDDKLMRKGGRFVRPELADLNPERLGTRNSFVLGIILQ